MSGISSFHDGPLAEDAIGPAGGAHLIKVGFPAIECLADLIMRFFDTNQMHSVP